MISIIENICVEQKKWITHDEMMEVTVIAESTPGPIAINCATYVGYRKKGMWGAIAATLGVVLPSFIIIYLISVFLNDFLEITWIANAFKGIRIAVGILILDAGIKMFVKMTSAAGIVFFITCGMKFPRISSLFGWNVNMKDGMPMTNISSISICFGVNG